MSFLSSLDSFFDVLNYAKDVHNLSKFDLLLLNYIHTSKTLLTTKDIETRFADDITAARTAIKHLIFLSLLLDLSKDKQTFILTSKARFTIEDINFKASQLFNV